MKILHRDDLELGGFAGLVEHRLIIDTRLFGDNKSNNSWEGIGNLVYLADAKFSPKGETTLHSHKEIDVISVMVKGSIKHEGSLKNGGIMTSHSVQVQRAGGEGFSHNEINPDDSENRMIQIWVMPEESSQNADYKMYAPKDGELMRIYGGDKNQNLTMDSHTLIDVGTIFAGKSITLNTNVLVYVVTGSGMLNGVKVQDGDLVRDEKLEFVASSDTKLIVMYIKK